jgi:hypothetical protein
MLWTTPNQVLTISNSRMPGSTHRMVLDLYSQREVASCVDREFLTVLALDRFLFSQSPPFADCQLALSLG